MSHDLKTQINTMLRDTRLTVDDISMSLGIVQSQVKDLADMTETELVSRDTQIMVYDIVGHDGSREEDVCVRCGIIRLYPHSGVPDGWGHHQDAFGNVCRSCLELLWKQYEQEINTIYKHGCCYCGDKKVSIYFYQSTIPGMAECYARSALPICKEHKGVMYDENKRVRVQAIRDFHNSLDHDTVTLILGGPPGRPGYMSSGNMLLGST